MATNTKNYQLTKPEGTDLVDIDVLNENFDTIDTQLKKNADALGNKQDSLTFDDTPTEGSSNPVTSGGLHTALQSAGGIPDWEQNDAAAVDYIKNRPFYRTIASTETIRSVDILEGHVNSYSPNWLYTKGYNCDAEIVSGQEFRVTAFYNNITVVKNVKSAVKDYYYVMECDEFRVKYIPARQTSGTSNIISISYAIAVFGGYTGATCSFKVERLTYDYTTLPEEYLDTGFAAPEFADTKRVETSRPNYSTAYILLYAGSKYYRNNAQTVFSSLLAGTEIAAKVTSLESSVSEQAQILDAHDLAISALQDTLAEIVNANQDQDEQIADLQSRADALEEADQDQAGLLASLQAQLQSLVSRVAYLESLHSGGGVVMSEADSVLSIDGTGAGVADGELTINAGTVSVIDGELVYGSGSSDTMSVDEDGTLNLTGSGIAAADGDLAIDSGSISVDDGALTTDAQ